MSDTLNLLNVTMGDLMSSTSEATTPPRFQRWHNLTAAQKERYLLSAHGPKHMETTLATGMTVFYAFLFLLGVPGNLLTCLIIFMNSYMRASPNYFLFNLAVADIITLVIGKKVYLIMQITYL